MVAAIILRENRVEIAAGKGYSPSSMKKRLSVAVGDDFIKNGKIVSPYFLGELLTAQLKKHRILPRQLLIAVRGSDIMIERIPVSDCGKNSLLQSAREILESEHPGLLEKNYIFCRQWDEEAGSLYLTVAIVPKILIDQYHALAAAMKCRISRLAIYADCMAKLDLKEGLPIGKKRIFVEIGGDFVQFYHCDGRELHRVSGFATQQVPFSYSEDRIRKELLDKICQNILALSGSGEESEDTVLYLNNGGYLEDLEIGYLKELLRTACGAPCIFMQDTYEDLDGELLNTLFADKKKGEGLIEASGVQDRRSAKSREAPGFLLALAAGAFLVTMSLGFFWYVRAGELKQKLEKDQAFVYANEAVGGLYLEHGKLKEEREYVEALKQNLSARDFDFRIVQGSVENIMEQGDSSLNSLALEPDFRLRVEASTFSYGNISIVMGKMEEAGWENVELLQIQSLEEQENPITYTITAIYTIKEEGAEPGTAHR